MKQPRDPISMLVVYALRGIMGLALSLQAMPLSSFAQVPIPGSSQPQNQNPVPIPQTQTLTQPPALVTPQTQPTSTPPTGLPANIVTPSTTTQLAPGRARAFGNAGRGLPGMPGGPRLGGPLGAQDPSADYMRPPVIGPLFCDPAVNIAC